MKRMYHLLFICILTACTTSPPPVISPQMLIRPKIALVLGGGAAKGFAHVGVIKVLEAQGIVPDIVVGTSAGSVVGSLYAAGYCGFQLQEVAFGLDETRIRDWAFSFNGLIKGEKLQAYINQLVKNRPIEKLNKSFGAVATDLITGHAVLFQRGNTGQAVRASSSLPGVFQSTLITGRRYVDGGVVSPVPVDAAKSMGADFVIAVDISAKPEKSVSGALRAMQQSITIMGHKLNMAELSRADVVLRPQVNHIGAAQFEQKHIAILEGEKIAMQMMPEIKRKIQLKAAQLNTLPVKK